MRSPEWLLVGRTWHTFLELPLLRGTRWGIRRIDRIKHGLPPDRVIDTVKFALQVADWVVWVGDRKSVV